jgi:S1-C subfamily serine protease
VSVPARLAAVALAALGAAGPCPAPLEAGSGAASLVEKEFAAAIRRVTPATVLCVAKGAILSPGAELSSGVIVTKDGYVLSDIDASSASPGKVPRTFRDDVEVRVPDLKKGTYAVHAAKVVARDEALDTTLMKITTPPSGGFPFVVPGTANDLRVGSITFVTGNSFGFSKEGTPTLTAGVVASLLRAPAGDPGGKYLELYTSAAVNPGVNGGPLVDVEGRLVGIISSWAPPDSPYQFLGKAFPVDRLRALYAKDVADVAAIFPDPKAAALKSKQSSRLEDALGDVAGAVAGGVVSLTVERPSEVKVSIEIEGRRLELPRYAGPVSGVRVSGDGWIVTSLYNLANTMPFVVHELQNEVADQLAEIVSVTAHLAPGKDVPATVVAHDEWLGIALLKAEVSEPEASNLWVPAPPESFQVGRMVLCLGNPFGAAGNPDPLLTVGIVSRVHPDADDSWRNDFQTDAAGTDATCGGALVDLRGRLLGVATIWNPMQHGRNSGISFGVPWSKIEAALPALKEGKSLRYGNGILGITYQRGTLVIGTLVNDGPAEKAGARAGDRVVAIDGVPVRTMRGAEFRARLHAPGEKVRVTVEREGKTIDLEVVAAERPAKD